MIRLAGTKKEDFVEGIISAESELLLKTQTAILECITSSQFDAAAIGCISTADFAFSRGDILAAAKYLAWYHSVLTRNWLFEKWTAALNPECEISAALKRLETLTSSTFLGNSMKTDIVENAIISEETFLRYASVPYRRLDVSTDPLEIVQKSIPSTSVVITIQFGAQDQNLYVSLVPGGSTDTGNDVEESSKIIVDELAFDEEMMRKLEEMVRSHRIWSSKIARMCSTLGDSMIADHDILDETFSYEDKELEKQERETERRLGLLLRDLDVLLEPILGPNSKIGTALSRNEEVNNYKFDDIMLLLDSRFCSLPWEGLVVFDQYEGRVYRDFSLHLYGHRTGTLFGPNGVNAGSTATVQASSVKYTVDPFQEDSAIGVGYKGMRASFDDLKSGSPNISKWTILGYLDAPLSLLDWIQLNEEKTPGMGLYVHMMGRLGSILSPRELAILNYEKISFAFVMDYGYNFVSYRRQESDDNMKSVADIACEDSISMAALLSLSGISGIVAQSWTTSLTSQLRFVSNFYSQCDGKDNNDFANAFAAGKRVSAEGGKDLKRWIRLARVYYGVSRIKINT